MRLIKQSLPASLHLFAFRVSGIEGNRDDTPPAGTIKALSKFQCQTELVRTVERRSIPGQSKYLSSKALGLGAIWMADGIPCGVFHTYGFHDELVNFKGPTDLE
jgi:hypothetical protein